MRWPVACVAFMPFPLQLDNGYLWDGQQCGRSDATQTLGKDQALPLKRWLRQCMERYLTYVLVLRVLLFFLLEQLDKCLAHFLGFSCKGLWSALRKGVPDSRIPPLRPGARALVWRVQQHPAVLDLDADTITAYRQSQETGMLTPGTPHAVRLIAPAVRWMGFWQYGLALGYNRSLTVVSACLHLAVWHMPQLLVGPLVFWCFCDLLGPWQRLFTGVHCLLRLGPYCTGLLLACRHRPAFILYHPGSSDWLDFFSHFLQPEMWLLKMAYLHKVRKPLEYWLLLAAAVLAEASAVPAVAIGPSLGQVRRPLGCLYLLGICSLLLSVWAQKQGDFFCETTEGTRVEEARVLKMNGLDAAVLRRAGFEAGVLRAACFPLEDLCAAGFSYYDFKRASFPPPELREASWLLGYMWPMVD